MRVLTYPRPPPLSALPERPVALGQSEVAAAECGTWRSCEGTHMIVCMYVCMYVLRKYDCMYVCLFVCM